MIKVQWKLQFNVGFGFSLWRSLAQQSSKTSIVCFIYLCRHIFSCWYPSLSCRDFQTLPNCRLDDFPTCCRSVIINIFRSTKPLNDFLTHTSMSKYVLNPSRSPTCTRLPESLFNQEGFFWSHTVLCSPALLPFHRFKHSLLVKAK